MFMENGDLITGKRWLFCMDIRFGFVGMKIWKKSLGLRWSRMDF
jgi:hypothetical protein